MAELRDVEIFKTGTHNRENYTSDVLDEMVRASKELDFEPAIKLGHKEDDEAPAFGYVRNLRRVGESLFADFFDLPEELFAKIKEKRYNRLSIELYKNLERAGKKFKWALKAVALLGAAIPGVAGLRPLSELFAENKGEELYLDFDLLKLPDAEPSKEEIDAAYSIFITMGSGPHAGLWNKYGSFSRCVNGMSGKVDQPEAFCAWLEHEATGNWPAEKHSCVPQHQGWDDFVLDAIIKEQFDMDVTQLKDRLDKLEKESKDAADAKTKAEKALADAQAKFTAELEARDKKAKEETEAREKKFKEEAEANAKRIAAMEMAARSAEIEKLADRCRVPALRAYVKQFAQLADKVPAGTEIKLFALDKDGKETTVAPEAALESFIEYVNSNSAKLFKVISKEEDPSGQHRQDDDAGEEVDKRVKEFRLKHPDKKYQEAMDAVLAADPALKERYALTQAA